MIASEKPPLFSLFTVVASFKRMANVQIDWAGLTSPQTVEKRKTEPSRSTLAFHRFRYNLRILPWDLIILLQRIDLRLIIDPKYMYRTLLLCLQFFKLPFQLPTQQQQQQQQQSLFKTYKLQIIT